LVTNPQRKQSEQTFSGSFGTEQQTVAEYAVNCCSSPFAAARIAVTTVRSCYQAGISDHSTELIPVFWTGLRNARQLHALSGPLED
jgi:hypothetical protein